MSLKLPHQIAGIKFLSLRDNNVSALKITECVSKPSSVSRGKEGASESEYYAKDPSFGCLPSGMK